MNETIGKIMANSKCPVCGFKKLRDAEAARSILKWKCTNDKCEKSKAWQRTKFHDHVQGLVNAETRKGK